MKEMELKFLEIKRKEIERKIKKLGGKKVFSGKIIAYYYDFPEMPLKKAGYVIRLRTEDKKGKLTIKKKIKSKTTKANIENDYQIENFQEARKIMKKAGLMEIKVPEKTRTSYRLGKAKFEFDKYTGLPEFLEIETNNEKEMEKAIKKLGLKKGKKWNVFRLLEHYKKRKKK